MLKRSGLGRWGRKRIVALVGAAGLVLLACGLPSVLSVNASHGEYRVESVTLSSTATGEPVPGDVPQFHPFDTVYCTVRTTGVDGIIGMRWILGNRVLYETAARTSHNLIQTYMAGSPSNPIEPGNYRVEVFLVKDPVAVAYFLVVSP